MYSLKGKKKKKQKDFNRKNNIKGNPSREGGSIGHCLRRLLKNTSTYPMLLLLKSKILTEASHTSFVPFFKIKDFTLKRKGAACVPFCWPPSRVVVFT